MKITQSIALITLAALMLLLTACEKKILPSRQVRTLTRRLGIYRKKTMPARTRPWKHSNRRRQYRRGDRFCSTVSLSYGFQVAATRNAAMTSPNTPMVAVKITPSRIPRRGWVSPSRW